MAKVRCGGVGGGKNIISLDFRFHKLCCICCACSMHHNYVLFNIIFMLYKGFEMECIHRCISQMSWCWLRSASLWAVSFVFILDSRVLKKSFRHGKVSHVLECHGKFKLFVLCYSQLCLLRWRRTFMPGCLWSSVKREVGLYHLQLHGFFLHVTREY